MAQIRHLVLVHANISQIYLKNKKKKNQRESPIHIIDENRHNSLLIYIIKFHMDFDESVADRERDRAVSTVCGFYSSTTRLHPALTVHFLDIILY